MKLLLAGIIVAAALAFTGSGAAASSCETDYYGLVANLQRDQRDHALWAAYLRANPGVAAPPDVGSAAIQDGFVAMYDRRIWATYYVAAGLDRASNLYWTIRDFEEQRAVHIANANAGGGFNGPAADMQYAAQYEWRIATLQRLAAEC